MSTAALPLTHSDNALSMFASEAEFHASQAERKTKYATQCLIPSGLFGPGSPPSSEVVAAGVVAGFQVRTNALTGLAFVAVQFETLGGLYELVLPAAEDANAVVPGTVIIGSFWVSGRILR